jgi:hypothetical protein
VDLLFFTALFFGWWPGVAVPPFSALERDRELEREYGPGERDISPGVVGADRPCRYDVVAVADAIARRWSGRLATAEASSASARGNFAVSGARVRRWRLVEERFLRRTCDACWLYASSMAVVGFVMVMCMGGGEMMMMMVVMGGDVVLDSRVGREDPRVFVR